MRIIAEVANITTSNLCVRCLPDTTKPQKLTNGIVVVVAVANITWCESSSGVSIVVGGSVSVQLAPVTSPSPRPLYSYPLMSELWDKPNICR